MKFRNNFFALALVLSVSVVPGQTADNLDFDLFIEDVELRPGVTVDIHLSVFVNEENPCRKRTSFAIPGLVHTAATWEPFVKALFEGVSEEDDDDAVCRVVAVDLPGHGESSLPTGDLLFGDLLLDDYVTALITTLERLRADFNIRPRTIMAHSQGGLLVQMVQQRLIDQGTNLRRAFKIRKAVLISSVAPVETPFFLAESGLAAQILSPFLVVDNSSLGLHFSIPAENWRLIFFTNFAAPLQEAGLVPGAPTAAEIQANGWNARAPLLASLQLIGATPLVRPTVDAGIFAGGNDDENGGTELNVITYDNDILILSQENQALYEYLTGDVTLSGLVVITDPNAVHDLQLSDPNLLLTVIAERVDLF